MKRFGAFAAAAILFASTARAEEGQPNPASEPSGWVYPPHIAVSNKNVCILTVDHRDRLDTELLFTEEFELRGNRFSQIITDYRKAAEGSDFRTQNVITGNNATFNGKPVLGERTTGINALRKIVSDFCGLHPKP